MSEYLNEINLKNGQDIAWFDENLTTKSIDNELSLPSPPFFLFNSKNLFAIQTNYSLKVKY